MIELSQVLPVRCESCSEYKESLCLYQGCKKWFCSDECHEEYHSQYSYKTNAQAAYSYKTNAQAAMHTDIELKSISDNLADIVTLLHSKFSEHDYSALLSFLDYYSDQPDGHFAFIMSPTGATLVFLT